MIHPRSAYRNDTRRTGRVNRTDGVDMGAHCIGSAGRSRNWHGWCGLCRGRMCRLVFHIIKQTVDSAFDCKFRRQHDPPQPPRRRNSRVFAGFLILAAGMGAGEGAKVCAPAAPTSIAWLHGNAGFKTAHVFLSASTSCLRMKRRSIQFFHCHTQCPCALNAPHEAMACRGPVVNRYSDFLRG